MVWGAVARRSVRFRVRFRVRVKVSRVRVRDRDRVRVRRMRREVARVCGRRYLREEQMYGRAPRLPISALSVSARK